MSFRNTLESVTKDIQEIEKIVSKFQIYSRIPAIELDLALSKLRNLYELLLMIRDHENPGVGNEPRNFDENKEIHVKETSAEVSETTPEIKEKPVSPPPVIEKEQEPVVEQVKEEPKKENEKPEIEETKPATSKKDIVLGEKLDKPKEFLDEKLAKESARNTRLQGGPITSITGSIGINDRFYYIREIFEGNSDNFKKAVDLLDRANNFNEAYNYLKSSLLCDMDSEAVQNLLNLVRRKFISSGNE